MVCRFSCLQSHFTLDLFRTKQDASRQCKVLTVKDAFIFEVFCLKSSSSADLCPHVRFLTMKTLEELKSFATDSGFCCLEMGIISPVLTVTQQQIVQLLPFCGSSKEFLKVYFSHLFRYPALDSTEMCRLSFSVGLLRQQGFNIKSNPVISHRNPNFFSFILLSPSKCWLL